MNKKASLLDSFQIVLVLFAFAIITIISLFVIDKFEEDASDMFTAEEATYAIDQGQATLLNFDNLFVFILIGLLIATIIGAYFIQTNPIIFWISLMLLLEFLTIAAIFTNVFEEITATEELASTAANFTIINLVMGHLPLTLLVIFSIISIALYAKWRAV